MESYRVQWSAGGARHTSAVAYNKGTAQERKAELEVRDVVTDVTMICVKPGE